MGAPRCGPSSPGPGLQQGKGAKGRGAEAPASLYAAVGLGVWWLHGAEPQEEQERAIECACVTVDA